MYGEWRTNSSGRQVFDFGPWVALAELAFYEPSVPKGESGAWVLSVMDRTGTYCSSHETEGAAKLWLNNRIHAALSPDQSNKHNEA